MSDSFIDRLRDFITISSKDTNITTRIDQEKNKIFNEIYEDYKDQIYEMISYSADPMLQSMARYIYLCCLDREYLEKSIDATDVFPEINLQKIKDTVPDVRALILFNRCEALYVLFDNNAYKDEDFLKDEYQMLLTRIEMDYGIEICHTDDVEVFSQFIQENISLINEILHEK